MWILYSSIIFLFIGIAETCFEQFSTGCKFRCTVEVTSGRVAYRSPIGYFFHFKREDIKGLTSRGKRTFNITHMRTGQHGEVIVWGEYHCSRIEGEACGRFFDKRYARAGDWVAGDSMIFDDLTLCQVDGSWGAWTRGVCSKSCGYGVVSRERLCNNPTPSGVGLPCLLSNSGSQRDLRETKQRNCNLRNCTVDGGWGAWSNFGQSTVTCGMGIVEQIRLCNNPFPLYGGLQCLMLDGKRRYTHESRTLSHKIADCPVDGGWGAWSNFGPSTVTCGKGIVEQIRLCNNPFPLYGGLQCLLLDGKRRNISESKTRSHKKADCPDLPDWALIVIAVGAVVVLLIIVLLVLTCCGVIRCLCCDKAKGNDNKAKGDSVLPDKLTFSQLQKDNVNTGFTEEMNDAEASPSSAKTGDVDVLYYEVDSPDTPYYSCPEQMRPDNTECVNDQTYAVVNKSTKRFKGPKGNENKAKGDSILPDTLTFSQLQKDNVDTGFTEEINDAVASPSPAKTGDEDVLYYEVENPYYSCPDQMRPDNKECVNDQTYAVVNKSR